MGLFNVLSSCCILVETRLCAGTPVDRNILIHLFILLECELVKRTHIRVKANTDDSIRRFVTTSKLEQHTETYRTKLGRQIHWVSLHCTKNPPPLPFPTVRWYHAQGGRKTHSNVYKNTQQPCQCTISLKKPLTGNCLCYSFRKRIVLINARDETDITFIFIFNRKWKKPFKSIHLLCRL